MTARAQIQICHLHPCSSESSGRGASPKATELLRSRRFVAQVTCAAVNSQHQPHRPSFEMAQRRQAQHLCTSGQRQRQCLPSTLSLRLQLSPSRRASTMRPAHRSEKAVSPSATAQSDMMAAGPLDTLLLSRSSRRRWSLRNWRRRYAKNATFPDLKLADTAISSFLSYRSTRNSRIRTSSHSTVPSPSTRAHTSSWICVRTDLWPIC